MKLLASLAAALCPTLHAAAQFPPPTVHMTTATPAAVGSTVTSPATFVGVPQGASADDLDLFTAPTPNPVRAALRAVAVNGPTAASARISTSVVMVGTAASARAAGTSGSPSAAGATFGPVQLLVRFQAPPGATGTIAVSGDRSEAMGPAAVVNRTMVDIGADGTPEVPLPGVLDVFPVSIDASGQVQVAVSVEHHVIAATTSISSSFTYVTLTLDLPVGCTITPYGNGCGGATSGGSDLVTGTTRAITLLGGGGFAAMPVLSLFGPTNAGPVLPGNCTLLTDASIVVPLVADAAGFTTHTFTLPVTAAGRLYHQFVPVDLATFAFRASNGLEIACGF